MQGDLKVTRNRELRLQRLQDSFKQLVEEKDAKLGNDSINSRAVIERTNLLRGRIEELEEQLQHAQKVRSYDSWPLMLTCDKAGKPCLLF